MKRARRAADHGNEIRAKPETAFGLRWPVFPVKLSRDPEEIVSARNEMFRYVRDSRGVHVRGLLPWANDEVTSPGARDLMIDPWGYLISTSPEPVKEYDVFERRPRVLDEALALDLRRDPGWVEEVVRFIAKNGFTGSTWRSGFGNGWVCGERLSDVRTDLRILQDLWKSWLALRNVNWRDLPTQKRGPGNAFPPYVDRMAISELMLDLESRLTKGIHPSLRPFESDEGHLRFTTGFTCETLSDALCLQLYLDITESRRYKKCRRCGTFFAQTHGNQSFCSPECSNTHRQKKWRERKESEED